MYDIDRAGRTIADRGRGVRDDIQPECIESRVAVSDKARRPTWSCHQRLHASVYTTFRLYVVLRLFHTASGVALHGTVPLIDADAVRCESGFAWLGMRLSCNLENV